MVANPRDFYSNEKKHFEIELQKVQKELRLLSFVRFLMFSSTVFCIYYFVGDAKIMWSSVLVGGGLFVFFLKWYWRKKENLQRLEALVNINSLEIDVLNGDVSKLETGAEFKNPKHAYSFDIDLFGKGSFFQFINRTVTKSGKERLVSELTANHIEDIKCKQEAVLELSKIPKWRQEFSALASSVHAEVSPNDIITWISNHKKSLPKFLKTLALIFSLISFSLVIGVSFFEIPFSVVIIWFFLGLGVSGFYLKKVNELYLRAGKVKATFQQYYKLLELLEKKQFSSVFLKNRHIKISDNGVHASKLMQQFFEYLNALDQRNNIIFAIFGNGLLLWDVKQAYRVENWMHDYKNYVKDWFEVISYFDAQNSLANYAFNQPEHTFPIIQKNGAVLNAKSLGHPLLADSQRVTSDCVIDEQSFFIVTGANMAGKSTFLRTISLSIIMSNMGLPVCSEKMYYTPIKLITSIRNSDSLSDDTSYFFSELKRLKFIVEALKTDDYFIVLDEILKGTNSTDKAKGSQQFVEKLVGSKATGIIATHDLSLCEIEKEYKEIHNYYFDAEIKNDELHFDYKLKKGVCQNMNASFLLRKMEIV